MADNKLQTIAVYPQVGGFALLQPFNLSGGGLVQIPAVADASDTSTQFFVQVTIDELDSSNNRSQYTVEYSLTDQTGNSPPTTSVQLVKLFDGLDTPAAGHDRVSNTDLVALYSSFVIVGETTGTQSFYITATLKKNGADTSPPSKITTTMGFGSKIHNLSLAATSSTLKKAWDGVTIPPPLDQSSDYLYEVTQSSNYANKIVANTYLQVLEPYNDVNKMPIVYASTASNFGTRLSAVPLNLFSDVNEGNFLGEDGTEIDQSVLGFVFMAETDAASGQVTYRISSGYGRQSIWMKAQCGLASHDYTTDNSGKPQFMFFNLPSVGSAGSLGQFYLTPNNIDFSNYLDSSVYAYAPSVNESELHNDGIVIAQDLSGNFSLAYGPVNMSEYQTGVSLPLTTVISNETYYRLVDRPLSSYGTVIKYTNAPSLTTEGTYIPKPRRNVARTYLVPTIPVTGYIDWSSVRNGLDVTVPFLGQPKPFNVGDRVRLTIYLNAYWPGTNDPRATMISQDHQIGSGENQYTFHFPASDVINYSFSNINQPGFFYADYQLLSDLNTYSRVLGDNDTIQLNTVPGDG